MSDNGPQFSASSFTKFAEEYGFTHITTSPRYPKANGQVQTMTTLLKKAADPYKALMAYHFTPLESGISPAELENPHKSPYLPTLLCPSWPYLEQFRQKDASLKTIQKKDFDRHHSVKTHPDFPPGEWFGYQTKKLRRLSLTELVPHDPT